MPLIDAVVVLTFVVEDVLIELEDPRPDADTDEMIVWVRVGRFVAVMLAVKDKLGEAEPLLARETDADPDGERDDTDEKDFVLETVPLIETSCTVLDEHGETLKDGDARADAETDRVIDGEPVVERERTGDRDNVRLTLGLKESMELAEGDPEIKGEIDSLNDDDELAELEKLGDPDEETDPDVLGEATGLTDFLAGADTVCVADCLDETVSLPDLLETGDEVDDALSEPDTDDEPVCVLETDVDVLGIAEFDGDAV